MFKEDMTLVENYTLTYRLHKKGGRRRRQMLHPSLAVMGVLKRRKRKAVKRSKTKQKSNYERVEVHKL